MQHEPLCPEGLLGARDETHQVATGVRQLTNRYRLFRHRIVYSSKQSQYRRSKPENGCCISSAEVGGGGGRRRDTRRGQRKSGRLFEFGDTRKNARVTEGGGREQKSYRSSGLWSPSTSCPGRKGYRKATTRKIKSDKQSKLFVGPWSRAGGTGTFRRGTSESLSISSGKAAISDYEVVSQRIGYFSGRVTGPGELVEAPRIRAAGPTAAQAPITSGSWPIGPGRVRAGLTPSGRGAPTGESGDQQLKEQQQKHQKQLRKKLPLPGYHSYLPISERRLSVEARLRLTKRRLTNCRSFRIGSASANSHLPIDRNVEIPTTFCLYDQEESSGAKVSEGAIVGTFDAKVRGKHSTQHHRDLRVRSKLRVRRNSQRKQQVRNQREYTINSYHVVVAQRSAKVEERAKKSRESSGFRDSDAGLPAARRTRTRVLAGAASSVIYFTTPTAFSRDLCRLTVVSGSSLRRYRRLQALDYAGSHQIYKLLPGVLDIVLRGIPSLLHSNRNNGEKKNVQTYRKATSWSTFVPKVRRQGRRDVSVPVKTEPMRLGEVRFAGPSFTTRLSEKKETRNDRRSCLRRLYYSHQARRRCRINLSSLVPSKLQLRQKIFESYGDCSMSQSYLCKQDHYNRWFTDIIGDSGSTSVRNSITGLVSSSSDNDQDSIITDFEKAKTFAFQNFTDESLPNDVNSNTEKFRNSIEIGIDNDRPNHDVLDVNDRKVLARLLRSTAFRIKSYEHHRAVPVKRIQSMEKPQHHKTSTEKKEMEIGNVGSCDISNYREICRENRNINVEFECFTCAEEQNRLVSEDELRRRTCLSFSLGAKDCKATRDVANVDALNVIYASSYKRYLLYDMLDHTAFNDDNDNDNENENHNGDNDDDYNICNDNDDDNCKDSVKHDNCDNIDKFADIKIEQSMVNDGCHFVSTKRDKNRWIFQSVEMSRKNAKEDEFISINKDNEKRVYETSACLDVPGGQLFTVLRSGRSYPNNGRTTTTEEDKNNHVFFTKNREPFNVDEISTESNGRTPGRPHDREKWKKPRRRRRRKYSNNKNNHNSDDYINNSNYNSSDDYGLLENGNENEYYREIRERNNNTARLHEPISRIEEKRNERKKYYNPFINEKMANAKEKMFAKDRFDIENDRRDYRQIGGKDKEIGSERRRRTSGYGLLFALYLLALPILCSTNSSGPAALAFAQKSPLTYGDNFTMRNASMQLQGHQNRSDGILSHDSSHPYNEYTWSVNQINPWISACDLAGPAPVDLQGSCGPPEVPKNCPLPCVSMSQGDINKPFFDVIDRLGILNRAKTGTGGSRWQPAGAKSKKKKNNDKNDDENMRSEEATMAPEQCLFYLDESHKWDICRDNFGRGSSSSFSSSRENRYWFMSGLRLRHCCEHAVVNALAPGKGGPLEDVLNGGRKCVEALDKLLIVDGLAARLHCELKEVLSRYDCRQSYSIIHNCADCKEAYRKWVCSSLVPYFAHGGPPASETSAHAWTNLRLRPCQSFCQSVEQRCPYLLPGDRAPAHPTQYAGEPTFLCQDPNIPETGEQALRATHGNEEKECCFHVCSEEEPGSGLCSNCINWEPHGHRAGHDIPSAPHCETATCSTQSGSAGHQNNADVKGNSNSGSSNAESASTNPSPLIATSASSCEGGEVGSMSSSSGQSTTQTPQPSSISLIYLFWVWAALISLCTGQTVFPWAPPSSLFMLDHPSSGMLNSAGRSADYGKIKKKMRNSRSSSSSFSKVAAASWWSCSSSSSSPSSSSLSRPRFHEPVLKLARVFLVSLFKTIHDYLRRFVNFFLVLVDTLLRCVKYHLGYWCWQLGWCDSIYNRWIKPKFHLIGGWCSRSRNKDRGWIEGPECCINGKWCGCGKYEPRPPRGRRRRPRRSRRRRRPRRRRRRRHPFPSNSYNFLCPLDNSTIANNYAGITGQLMLAKNRCYYYGDASILLTLVTEWCYYFYRSQRHFYSYCKWKGPS